MTTTTLPTRSEAEKQTDMTWDLTSVYATEADWEKDFAAVEALLPKLAAYKGRLGESGALLLEALRASDDASKTTERVFIYSHLNADEDTANSHFEGLQSRAKALITQLSQALSYMAPELLAIEPAKLETFITTTAGLELYKQQLDELTRLRDHVRSAEVEELLSQLGEVRQGPRSTFGMWNNADIKFPTITGEDGKPVQVTHSNYQTLLHSHNRDVRKAAFEAVFGTYKSFRNTLSANYTAQVKLDIFASRAARFTSAREAALKRINVPLAVYDSLVSTVGANMDKLQRYLELRKKILGLDELHCYDLYVPLVAEVDYKVTYKEAQELVLAAVAPLGKEYVDALRQGFASRWVDAVENQGKRSGAYSSGMYGTNPYILMSWQNTLEALFTLAHEAGHSMHTYFTTKNQPYPYADYTIFVAEVASTCNEALLAHHLLATVSDPAVRKYIINHQLESFRLTLYRQTLFAEFEQIAHARAEEGKPLTADELCKIHKELNQKYYAPTTTLDDVVEIEWARIPHFYSPFYVYQYSTGIAAATALAKQILTEGEPAVRRYLKFLSSGKSDYSINLLKAAGVDLSTPAPVQQALDTFAEYLTEFEKLVAGAVAVS
jgi:oligoendopeptidase F